MPPLRCCLREYFITFLAKLLDLQLPLPPRAIALAVHLLCLLFKQSLTQQVISVIHFIPHSIMLMKTNKIGHLFIRCP